MKSPTSHQRPDVVIVAPPPTPNGDLHVGHLAGPYLAADVFCRFERLRGRRVVTALSTDKHQSYVVTTAERSGQSPEELAHDSHLAVQRTLMRAGMPFDIVGRPDASYAAFVTEWLERLLQAGVFVEQEVDTLVDPRTGRHLVEAYVGGRCPECFESTRGNICDGCGHPNYPSQLVHPSADGTGADRPETRRMRSLVMPLDRYRARLAEHYCSHQRLRPELAVLLDGLLAKPLPDFPIAYESEWGLPLRQPGWSSFVYNVWAEMYPGHLHWTERARAQTQPEGGRTALWRSGDEESRQVEYVQFIGFDNSFFYAVVHVAMSMAARDAGLPATPLPRIVTNQFYLLDGSKFSTSQGHAIWGGELLDEWESDPVRLYLCLSNPETQESNFTVDEMEQRLEAVLLEPFERVTATWNRLVEEDRVTDASTEPWAAWHRAFRRRFEACYDLDSFSLRRAASTFLTYLDFLGSEYEQAERSGDICPASSLGFLATCAAPLMPGFATRLAKFAGLVGAPSWTAEPAYRREFVRAIPKGQLTTRRTPAREAGAVHGR